MPPRYRSFIRYLIVLLVAVVMTACGTGRNLQIGQRVPGFHLPDERGRQVDFDDLRGQVVLLNFWATWCEPCKEEMPIFQSLLDAYGDSGLAVVLVALGDDREDVAAYLGEHGYSFIALVDEEAMFERTYGINTLPTTLLIDAEGVLVSSWTGPVEEELTLQQRIVPMLATGRHEGPTPQAAVPPSPTATSEAEMAIPTETALPTAVPILPSPTASPVLPTPTDTATPTPTPEPYSIPELYSPHDGTQFVDGVLAELRWGWDGELGEDEYFDVRFWSGDDPHYGVAWTKEPIYAVSGEPGRTYYWAIAIIRGQDGQVLEHLTVESEARRLVWVYPTPTSTPIPPSYGVSVRCGQRNQSAPSGQLVSFFVDVANTGNVDDTYSISMSPGVPGGWDAMFCIGSECYTGGSHPITVPPGGSGMVEVKIESAGGAPSGQQGSVTLIASSQGDSSKSGAVSVTLTIQ